MLHDTSMAAQPRPAPAPAAAPTPTQGKPIALLQLGIGIVTYNRRTVLSETLDRVRQHTKHPRTVIAVADDGSTDGTQDMLRERNVLTVTGRNMSIAWNKNRALFLLSEMLRCDVVLLLEDDAFPASDHWEARLDQRRVSAGGMPTWRVRWIEGPCRSRLRCRHYGGGSDPQQPAYRAMRASFTRGIVVRRLFRHAVPRIWPRAYRAYGPAAAPGLWRHVRCGEWAAPARCSNCSGAASAFTISCRPCIQANGRAAWSGAWRWRTRWRRDFTYRAAWQNEDEAAADARRDAPHVPTCGAVGGKSRTDKAGATRVRVCREDVGSEPFEAVHDGGDRRADLPCRAAWGWLANRMIQHGSADLPKSWCRAAGSLMCECPEWDIDHPPLELPEPLERATQHQHIEMAGLAERARIGQVRSIVYNGYGQRMENFLCRGRLSRGVPCRRSSVRCGSTKRLPRMPCARRRDPVRRSRPELSTDADRIPYADIVAETGLTPVFMGQTGPSLYIGSACARGFPKR